MTHLNKNMRKPIFIILIIFGFILPITANADLVICGTSTTQECTFCDIFRMMQTIMNYIWWALLVIAPLFIIAGGLMILTAGIKPEQLELGKRIITGTVVGLAIAFLSWTILNVVFITLVKEPGQEGFPWPWNEIQCTGGRVAQGQPCTTDADCTPLYCDWFGTNTCVSVENLVCEIWMDCPSDYDCGSAGRCVRITTVEPGGNYCCCMFPDGSRTCDNLVDSAECNAGCLSFCQQYAGFSNYCCRNEAGDCSGAITGRCGEMSAAGTCTFNNRFTCQTGVNDQVIYTTSELLSFLGCMATYMDNTYTTLPPPSTDYTISSLTDNSGGRCFINWNTQCTGTTDSCEGTCCGHSQNSLHYGGTNCRGTSYAVDIATIPPDAHVEAAFSSCSSSFISWGAQLVPESTHIHIELDGLARSRGCLGPSP